MEGDSFSYKKAGVDIEAGERMVRKIKDMVRSTFRPEVLTEIGGFAGLFKPNMGRYKEPVFAAATDGVGTKLKLAFMLDKHNTVGIDAVAMCVNDLVVQGAEPLFFLDYLAVGKLEESRSAEIISGVVEGCKMAGCALLGGETAEMPGFYAPGEYDLAGFAVGIVEKEKVITGKNIVPGDILIGLASNGLHSNGFSLVRKILFEHAGLKPEFSPPQFGCSLGEELLRPTFIYVPLVLSLLKEFEIKGIAHITGGGLKLNLPRVFPPNVKGVLHKFSWEIPPIFPFIQELGKVEEEEMYRTFNMGIGMVLVVSPEDSGRVLNRITQSGWKAWEIGSVDDIRGEQAVVEIS
jgi:phosphoribosylformylglycinamidine cyclo-ligase